jgi:hypothetical protein
MFASVAPSANIEGRRSQADNGPVREIVTLGRAVDSVEGAGASPALNMRDGARPRSVSRIRTEICEAFDRSSGW